mmetsp:Transcript_15576/g.38852  ORF Transcript_15576/g.38852 Transcript_15576/m.38852 type:complete len:831 (+) Transcript_15576:198-2690(+)
MTVGIGKKNSGTRNNNDNKIMMNNRNNPHVVRRRSGGSGGKSTAVIVVVVCCWMILSTAATANNNLYEKSQRINYNYVARLQHQPASGDSDDITQQLPSSSSSSMVSQQRQQQEAPTEQDDKDSSTSLFPETYKLWDASKFPKILEEWKELYPDFVRVTTSQDKYGLPTAGEDHDCPFYEGKGCPNYIMTIQDFVVHPDNSESSNSLPEVFWSGCLHGNERVGPTSVMEAATLLLEAAMCESLPRASKRQSSSSSKSSLDEELQEAKICRRKLHQKGIDDVHRKWLARIVSTRRIVVVPTANALGYFRDQREEGKIDPNRDFPYDLTDDTQCMQTIAGRTINEIYREHMFQLALTFHAGMEVVSYEWGAPSWLNHFSPDHEAQTEIAAGYSRYGGGWSRSKAYDYGTMNDMVYFVRGGMEDWAYAGSWTPEKVMPCQPKQFGGYPKEKTTYNDSTLRVFNMLIETSNRKTPAPNDLGTSLDVLQGDTTGNGHVSRNVRLALLAAEMVEPYVSVVGVNKLALSDDAVPLETRTPQSCKDTKAVMIAKNAEAVDIEWTVGGSMTVDVTELWYAKWDDVADKVSCWTRPSSLNGFERVQTMTTPNNGTGAFSLTGSHPKPSSSMTGESTSLGPLFRASIPVTGLRPTDKIIVIASARVDSSWADQPANIAPKMPPQSHVVNARTNPDWNHESNGKRIQGRLDWFSVPLTIVVGDFVDAVGTRDDDVVNTIELHPRLGEGSGTKGGIKPKTSETDQLWFPVAFWVCLAGGLVFLACCVCCCTGRSDLHGRKSVRTDDDDYGFESKPYSDDTDAEYGEEYDDGDEDGIEIPTRIT